jgi:arylformamidase
VLRDQRYGSGPKESLDLFLPRGPARGTFVFVHGGYWRSLDKAEHAFVAPPLNAQGIAVAVVNYDLCPRVSIATIVDQAARAVAWVIGEGARHGASAHRLVVGGHSAGGHVAAMLMARDWRDDGFPMNPLHGGVSLSGVHDLRPLTRFSYNVDLKLDDDEAARALAGPARGDDARPLVVAVGANETGEFLRQSDLMWDAWPANRPPGMAGPLVIPASTTSTSSSSTPIPPPVSPGRRSPCFPRNPPGRP